MADDILTLRDLVTMIIEYGDLDAPAHIWAYAADGPFERHWVDGFVTDAQGRQEFCVRGERQAIREGQVGRIGVDHGKSV